MSRFRVEFLPSAARDYKSLDPSIQPRIRRALERLIEEPLLGKPLQGPYAGRRSLRIGEYRAVYRPLPKDGVILIHAIGHRRDVYRY